jgi:hypothetical protein
VIELLILNHSQRGIGLADSSLQTREKASENFGPNVTHRAIYHQDPLCGTAWASIRDDNISSMVRTPLTLRIGDAPSDKNSAP